MSDINQKDLDAETRFKEMNGENLNCLMVATLGNVAMAARLLGVTRNTVDDILRSKCVTAIVLQNGALTLLTPTRRRGN